MAFNNLPSAIQSVIQTGFLERSFGDSLRAKLGFRAIADREQFAANIGESITKTRTGLLPAVTTPMAAASNTDITSGLTPQNYSVEQYILSVNQYAANMMLNVATSRVAIADLYLRNAETLLNRLRAPLIPSPEMPCSRPTWAATPVSRPLLAPPVPPSPWTTFAGSR